MIHIKVQLDEKNADGYIIPMGPIRSVSVVTDVGMVGCGIFDAAAMNNYGYPAAIVKSSRDGLIETIDDLLEGIVGEVNPAAERIGLKVGITGRDAANLLSATCQ